MGIGLLEKAAGQGHAYAMLKLAEIYDSTKEYDIAFGWLEKGAETGLPQAMYNLGCCFDRGKGVAAPDYLVAADWYRRAADAGDADAAFNMSHMSTVGRGWAWQVQCLPPHVRIVELRFQI